MMRSRWRALGFYFDFDADSREIRIHADNSGLRSFVEEFRGYGSDPLTVEVGHAHLGPYFNLTLETSMQTMCTSDVIQGTHDDFLNLASEVEKMIGKLQPGESFLSQHFCNTSSIRIRFVQQHDEFDPASLDPELSNSANQ